MKFTEWALGLAVACSLASGARAAESSAPSTATGKPEIQVRAQLDRSAMWVADLLRYEVEVRCQPGVDVLDDDLAREKLQLDGLEVVSSEVTRETTADNATVHRFTYVLTTYRVDGADLRVRPMSLRYYVKRPGRHAEDAAPAGEVEVPEARVALRSTLPDQQDTAELRDGRRPEPRSAAYSMAQPVGLALILVSLVPSAFWTMAMVQKHRRRGVGRSARQMRQEERASLESVRALDVRDGDARRQAYASIDVLVREHLRDVFGVPGPSLTPDEVAVAVEQRHARVPAATVAGLLAECERARYAPPDALPSADTCREAILRAEQLLAAR